MIKGDADMELLQYFGYPSLHVMLGLVNKLCDDLAKVWEDFYKWPAGLHLVREQDFGKTYDVMFERERVYSKRAMSVVVCSHGLIYSRN